MTSGRGAELALRLAEVRSRVAAACARAGRREQEVTTIVVTKTFPVSDIRHLADLGVRDVGESKDQEASAKAAELASRGLRWHFVGRLQSNKAAHVAGYADVVHSVDRARLVAPLGRGAREGGRPLDCLVQVSLDADPSRGGARPLEVAPLADAVAREPGLRLAGVMAVAPRGADPDEAFSRLAEVAARLRQSHPGAVMVSAGMSADLEAAVRCGATHLRVGRAILGSRPPLQ